MADSRSRSASLAEPLTEREQEILTCLVEGLSNREIADRLFLSPSTVKWYNSQIYSKLGVSKREAAADRAQALGLIGSTPERPPPDTRHNLAAQTTAFIGRQDELAAIAGLLADPDTRLLTILAPGGMGKTRLALEAARQQLTRFKDGVFFIPLAPLGSPDHIVTAIAENVGFSFFGSELPQQQLLEYLHKQNTLLILDNFEHLLNGIWLVTDLLQTAPAVKVLVTSRERLSLHGETVYTLRGLRFPTLDTVDDALDYDAMTLFMQIARRVRPDYPFQPDDLEYVTHICRLTEGMPLAVELAAGWIDVLSPQQIAAEIRQGIDILETDRRDVPDRQRSIRATFERTWSRLSDDERSIYERLSVFRGGFTLTAAQAVAHADVRSLRKLANKALLVRTPRGRYEIHELLRQIAGEHLTASGNVDAICKIHSEYYLHTVAQSQADIKGRRQLAALHEIEADFENVRAAWRWAASNEGRAELQSALKTLEVFGECGKRVKDIDGLFRQVAESALPDGDMLRCQTLSRSCHLLKTYSQHVTEIEACLAAMRRSGEPLELAYQLRVAAAAYGTVKQESSQAIQLLEEAITLYEHQDDAYGVAMTLTELAYWLTAAGYDQKSHETVEQSYHLSRQIGAKNVQAFMAAYLGVIAADRLGRFDEARRLYTEAIEIFREMTATHYLGSPLANIGYWVYLLADGDIATARDYANQALRFALDTHNTAIEAFSTLVLGMIAGIEQDYLRARELLEAGRALSDGEPYKTLAADCGLALVHYGLGQIDTAKRYVNNVLSFFLSGFRCVCITISACIQAREGKLEQAAELMAFVSESPNSPKGWMQRWHEIAEVRSGLEAELGSDLYVAAWERGKSLDLETIVEELLVEYGADDG